MSLLDVHEAAAWVVMLMNLAAGAWSLAAHRDERARVRPFWAFVYAAHATVALQITLGVIVHSQAGSNSWNEAPSIHMFYGFVALASVAIIAGYRQQLEEWRFLLYGLGSLFLMGLSIRSFFLVGPI